MFEAWRGELLTWWETLRGLPHNPIATYFRLTEKRSRKRSRAWIWWTALVILVLIGVVLMWQMYIVPMGSGYTPGFWELVMLIAGLAMMAASIATGAMLVHHLFNACLDAFSVLGSDEPSRARPRRLLIDDMLATTTMTDHEITAGVLWVLAPPLWKVALCCGGVYWGWLVLIHLPALEYGGDGELVRQIITGPLVVAGVTICGSLAGLVIITWLMVLGTTVSRRLNATASALLICLGQVVMIPISITVAMQRVDTMSYGRVTTVSQQVNWDIGLSIVLVLLFWALLRLVLRWPGRLAGLGWIVPVLVPLVMGLVMFQLSLENNYELQDRFAFSYMHGWSVISICNAAAVPTSYCLPELSGWNDSRNLGVEVYFLLQLLQLLMMGGVGLVAVRRAVGIRRQNIG